MKYISVQDLLDHGKELRFQSAEQMAKVYDELPGITIIHCKDCERNNVAVKDWYDDHEKKVCPLVGHRGKAQGHEFDYQFCVYGCLPEIMTPPQGETNEKEKRSKRKSI